MDSLAANDSRSVPAIVAAETFERVQQRLVAHKRFAALAQSGSFKLPVNLPVSCLA
jgi:hypothetical protein